MDAQILIGLLLTVLPVTELRIGLPVIVDYLLENNISVWPYFALVLILNILVIFFIFFFLDYLHEHLMKVKIYRGSVGRMIERIHRRAHRVHESRFNSKYVALMFFVAVPLPGTGAWTGSVVAWILGLSRKKSFVAISAGVVIAGILILFMSLGLLPFFKSLFGF